MSPSHSLNMRARLAIDAAHLRYTFPKLVVADVVEDFSVFLYDHWKDIEDITKRCPSEKEAAVRQRNGGDGPSIDASPTYTQFLAAEIGKQGTRFRKTNEGPAAEILASQVCAIYGPESVQAIAEMSRNALGLQKPKQAELRQFLFEVLTQEYEVLLRQKLLSAPPTDNDLSVCYIDSAANAVARGLDVTPFREAWNSHAHPDFLTKERAHIAWPLALQAGLLDHNIKRLLESLALEGKISEADAAVGEDVHFFQEAVSNGEDVVRLWDLVIQQKFPIHVFSLDPQVEEQNVYDAFSRRREMQISLAISVAKGRLNTAQRVDMSRQLALDMASIDLNRTSVAFSHDNDTFGWYFYPRVQSPPEERSNVAALARMIWSTGPTEHYDQKHLSLEPGMRECEVLIAMPSFVPHVEFDVTTNWERLTKPGATKQSYEEMLALGGRIHRLRCNLCEARDTNCFRPGDYARLISRVDQLEKMLSLQSYEVNVPYEYEQSGTTLFNKGDVQLRPVLHDYYGLNFVTTDEKEGGETYFFLQGQNFHPTLTHLIVGGSGSDSFSPETEADVQVISRELIRVKVNRLFGKLSDANKFVIRCGTPAGLSNPLVVEAKPEPPAKKAEKEFALAETQALSGKMKISDIGKPCELCWNQNCETDTALTVLYKAAYPLPINSQIQIIAEWTIKTTDGDAKVISAPIPGTLHDGKAVRINCGDMRTSIANALRSRCHATEDYQVAKGKLLLRFGEWPFIEVDGELEMKVVHGNCCLEKPTAPYASADNAPTTFAELIESPHTIPSPELNLPMPLPAP